MYQPRVGERVWVLPTNPSEPVQRAAHMYGQFLSHSWQECTWDEFLNARLHDGSIIAASEPPKPPIQQAQSGSTSVGDPISPRYVFPVGDPIVVIDASPKETSPSVEPSSTSETESN